MDPRRLGIYLFIILELWSVAIMVLVSPPSALLSLTSALSKSLLLLGGNGIFLLGGGVFMTLAKRALRQKKIKYFQLWLWSGILSGIGFLGMSNYEGKLLLENFSSAQELLKGLSRFLFFSHFLQVGIGVIWSMALGFTGWFRLGWSNINAIHLCTLYWYGMILLWLELIIFIY